MTDTLFSYDFKMFGELKTKKLQTACDTLRFSYAKNAAQSYELLIKDNESILSIFGEVLSSDPVRREELRQKLYDLFDKRYKILEKYGIDEFHFHLPGEKSFLCLHDPSQRGKQAPLQKREADPGFRYRFPIEQGGTEVGSVVIGCSFQTLQRDLKKLLGRSDIIVYPKVEQMREQSTFLAQNGIDSKHMNIIANEILQKGNGKTFSVHENGVSLFATVVPIKTDALSEAFLISYGESTTVEKLQDKYVWLLIFGIAVVAVFSFILWQLQKKALQIKRAKKRIIEQNGFLESILENSPIPIFYKAKDGRYRLCNKRWLEMTGYGSTRDVIGKTVFDIAPRQIANMYSNHDKKVFSLEQNPQIYRGRVYNNKTGKIREVMFYKRAHLDCEGRVEGLVGAAVDISEELQTYREREKFYRASEYSPSIIVMTDCEGMIDYVNPAFCKVTGYSAEQVRGTSAYELGEADAEKIRTTLETGLTWEGQVYNRKNDGSMYWQKTKITPYYDASGKLAGYVSVGEDVTKEVELQRMRREYTRTLEKQVEAKVEKIRQKDNMLMHQSKMAAMGEMIGSIAHQWKQPLNTLFIRCQLLEDDFEEGLIDEEYIYNFIVDNERTLHYMSDTIDDFMNFFKPSGEEKIFAVYEAIEDTMALLKESFDKESIEVHVTGGRDLYVAGYKNELNQVLINILKNSKDAFAVKKSDGKRLIRIDAGEVTNGVKVTVEDSAGGIKEELLDKVFEPYFTTKDEHTGTGIGLYISKMIMEEKFNGEIIISNISGGLKTELTIKADDA